MKELDELRIKIDEVDIKMKELFLARMEIVNEIKIIKNNNNIKVKNKNREKEVINKLTTGVNSDIIKLYESFIKHTIKLSRKFQEGKNE
jgi:chorismate mutase